MKPEDRRRLKQHIEMIVEHKEPTQTENILRDAVEEQIKGKLELEDKNRKLRLELYTLRFKESQESRFVWWIYQVYARHVSDLLTELERTTFPATPFGMSNTIKRLKEYTEHIYDGTYLDTAMSTEQSNSDVSMTEDVLTDIKTGQSIENTNPDYYKGAEKTALVRLCGALGVLTENNDLATAALLAATRIESLEKKIPALNVDLAEASIHAYNGEVTRMKLETENARLTAELASRDEIIKRMVEAGENLIQLANFGNKKAIEYIDVWSAMMEELEEK